MLAGLQPATKSTPLTAHANAVTNSRRIGTVVGLEPTVEVEEKAHEESDLFDLAVFVDGPFQVVLDLLLVCPLVSNAAEERCFVAKWAAQRNNDWVPASDDDSAAHLGHFECADQIDPSTMARWQVWCQE